MFPLNWNIPFIRKNGSRTTLGAITGDIAGIEEDLSDLTEKTDGLFDNMLKNGAVNLLPNDATTQTISGVTFTVNDDKTVTANGTATENLELVMTSTLKLENKTYKLTGCPSGGSATTFKIDVQIVDGAYPAQDVGRGATFTASSSNTYKIRIIILSGVAVSNLTFKPMLSDPALNLSYNDYVPYAMTNRELTEEITTVDHYVSGDVISGNVVPIGSSNAGGTEIYVTIPLPKRVLSDVTISPFTININWARAGGSSITTDLTVKTVVLLRPNILGVTIGGTFTPITLYAVSLNISSVIAP